MHKKIVGGALIQLALFTLFLILIVAAVSA
jgi:hypothetical protein